jgi:hypothetical protein
MKKQGFNPYLPSWEYIPDGEPYVFNNRVYVYGSHDRFNGYVYCLNDYVCWSAPEDDITEWRYEGVIYKKTDDPLNSDGSMCLYAPDVTVGPDGRYYLYYVLDKVSIVSVAVCNTPAGKYEFFGYVHYPDNTKLGNREGDEPQFDPGVLTEGNRTYLYTGFCGTGDMTRTGAMATVLDSDMLTVINEPVRIVPGNCYGKDTGFEGHEYFEAASIRKYGDIYYFIYSSSAMNELCYATSRNPVSGFKYGGVIISNTDKNIASYKPSEKLMNYNSNNHGSIAEINGKRYIFYHRHTNAKDFSRQGCLEQIIFNNDCSINQVTMTSCGPNNGPLAGTGEYPSYIACNFFCIENEGELPCVNHLKHDPLLPFVTQEGKDGDEETGFVANINNKYGIGFKYFECKGITKVSIKTQGYNNGVFEVRTSWNGLPLGLIKVEFSNVWKEFSSEIVIPDGIQPLYFVFKGKGPATLKSFTLS